MWLLYFSHYIVFNNLFQIASTHCFIGMFDLYLRFDKPQNIRKWNVFHCPNKIWITINVLDETTLTLLFIEKLSVLTKRILLSRDICLQTKWVQVVVFYVKDHGEALAWYYSDGRFIVKDRCSVTCHTKYTNYYSLCLILILI